MLVLGFPDCIPQANHLAELLASPCQIVDIHHFPDGESRVTIPAGELPSKIIWYRSLDRPNNKLIELLLAATTARALGACCQWLVAPYLCYMRQDMAFHGGEAISQTIIGDMLGNLFDRVITVDPHLHRIDRLEQAIPCTHAVALSSAPLMGDFIHSQTEQPLLIGPDHESEQWVSSVAQHSRLDYGIAHKSRHGDKQVRITLPDTPLKKRDVVLIDDMVSTGHTLCETAKLIMAAGANKVDCLVTHAIFTNNAVTKLKQAGIEKIWSTDSVSHPSNTIPLAGLLKEAIGTGISDD